MQQLICYILPFTIASFLLMVPLSFQGKDWTEYVVEAGSHDFLPNDFPAPLFGADTYTVDLKFSPSCWWSAEDPDYTGGRDIKDWNKIGGMTNFFNANSTHSVLLGWRPAETSGMMELTAYVNPKSGRFVSGPVLMVPVDQALQAQIIWYADSVRFEYGEISFTHPIEKPWAIRKVGPWFGGNQTAHREMTLMMKASFD